MATEEYSELIQVSTHYTASLREIKRVWNLISQRPTITTRQIAVELGTSRTRAFHIVSFLKKAGFISNRGKRWAWDVRVPYVEIQS